MEPQNKQRHFQLLSGVFCALSCHGISGLQPLVTYIAIGVLEIGICMYIYLGTYDEVFVNGDSSKYPLRDSELGKH